MNNRINRTHERALYDDNISTVVYDDNISTVVYDDNISTVVYDDNISTVVYDDNISTVVYDDNISTVVYDDNISTVVYDDNISTVVYDDNISTVVYDDNISTVVYDDNISTVDDLLKKDGSVSIHMRNIQAIAIELCKVVHNLSPKMMNQIFVIKESKYPSKCIFQTNNIRTTKYGLESLKYLGPKIWELIPEEIKNISSLELFKRKIKEWCPKNCPCKLCKLYVQGVGYESDLILPTL